MRRTEAQEALQWCMAFSYLAFNPTGAPEISGALQIRRARFSLDQLRSLRNLDASQVAELSKKLMLQPEKFLAEVGLGFDLAHMLLQRHNPQLSEKMHSPARPIDVELVAPEMEQAVQSVRSELIDRYAAGFGFQDVEFLSIFCNLDRCHRFLDDYIAINTGRFAMIYILYIDAIHPHFHTLCHIYFQ